MSDPNRRTALLSLTVAGLLALLPSSRTVEAAEKEVAVTELFVLEPLNLGDGFAASKVTIDGLFNQGAPTRDEIVKSLKKCQIYVIDQRIKTKDGVRFGDKDYPQVAIVGPLHHEWEEKKNKFSIQIASLKTFANDTNYDTKPPTRHISATVTLMAVGETALARTSSTTHFSMPVPTYGIDGRLVK